MCTYPRPVMSVIVIAADNYESVRQVVQALGKQTIQEKLELVFVAIGADRFVPDRREVSGFASVRIIEGNPMETMGQSRAVGIRAAQAPIIVLAENHSFPEPDWAEALARAHQHPWAAVGPAVNLAPPATRAGWAFHFITYARWMAPVRAGAMDDLPGHNSSYKRDVLLNYGDQLGALLDIEVLLHWDLQTQGRQLYLEPAAQVRHRSLRLGGALQELFIYGRAFAARRASRWRLIRRISFALAAPLVPLVRFQRIRREVRRLRKGAAWFASLLPLLLVGLLSSALGEFMGYAFGIGNALALIKQNELYGDRCGD